MTSKSDVIGWKFEGRLFFDPQNTNARSLDLQTNPTANEMQPASTRMVVYPNPVDFLLTVQLPDDRADNVSVRLTDFAGRTVHRKKVDKRTFTIDMSPFEKGVYILHVETAQKVFTDKIIKK
jgi:hypothetical protein